jgi:hypothetical protein
MSAALLEEGVGSFMVAGAACGTRRTIRVFYFCPKAISRTSRIVIAMHGLDRAAGRRARSSQPPSSI